MSPWRIALRLLRQDWRSGEFALLSAALVLTVAAVTAVGFFTDRIGRAMERQGGELIAADLAIDGSSAPPEDWAVHARGLGLSSARTLEFPSVVMGEQGSQLVQVKAAGMGYPLRGQLRVRDSLDAPERPVAAGPPPGEIWVEGRLLGLLAAEVGDALGLGEIRPRIGAVLSFEPDRGGSLFQLAPRVLMNTANLEASGLVSPASRVRHRLLLAGDLDQVEDIKDWVAARLPANLELVDARNARPEFASAVERASRFLHLAALVTLLVAGSAIALASRRLVERQTDAVAVMRALGAPRHLLTRVFLLRLVLFALAASLVGCLVGWLGQGALVAALADWMEELPPPSWRPVPLGIATGVVALLGFALPPLIQLARVQPLRALRRDLGTPRASTALAIGGAAMALGLLVFWQAGDPELALKLLAGVAAALAALVGAVLLLVRLASTLVARSRGVWRLGIAGLTRRPGGAVLQIAGFGLGILALLLLAVVRVDLLRTWQQSLPEGTPNLFLINIQPQEVDAMRAFLASHGLREAALYPMIRGRLTHIGGREIDPADYPDGRAERLASREFNLSFAETPQDDNRVVAGRWWEPGTAEAEFSVEVGVAETLGIALGHTLSFWVSDHPVEGRVTSLREVQWDSFNVNFFVVAPPALLGPEPATYITSFHLPGELEQEVVPALVRSFPSVTLLDIQAILAQVRQVVDRGVLAVEYVFLFTLAAGVLVMIAGIQASLAERRSEHAVLRTLGTGRGALLGGLAVEFTAMGLVAGLLASVFAELTGWLLADQVFGLPFAFNPSLWVTGVLGSAVLIGLTGTLTTYPLLVRPPLHTLRRAG
jgi:putative ABC transport system permease protein